jgi:23S rRNA G2445 N2-methylase RlmL
VSGAAQPTVIARTVRGLEWVVAAEVSERLPDASGIMMRGREVTFRLPSLSPGLLDLRSADDAFLVVGRIGGVEQAKDAPRHAAQRIAGLDWPEAVDRLTKIRELQRRPPFDVVASLAGRRRYNRYALEDAVGSVLAPRIGGQYLARTGEGRAEGEPDLTVRVFVEGAEALVALRLASRPLHRRWYKQDTGPGTLHPPLAAAMAQLAGPPPGAALADPFCGDGTLAIEAAAAYPGARVLANDIDAVRLDNARRNAERAGVRLAFSQLDAGQLPWAAQSIDVIITNPPWGVTVGAQGTLHRSLDRYWRQVPELLTPSGRLVVITDAAEDSPARFRQQGYQLALATQVRLAGRVSHVVLAAPSGHPRIPAALQHWRDRGLADGVITESGF